MYNLPKKYISYSAYSLWKQSKVSFRKRYYLNEPQFETVETKYGKHIGSHIENGGTIEGILNYSHKEYPIEVEYEGIPILGYLDQFDEENLKILEMKTGHKNKKGENPWNRKKVKKHAQLVWYSLMVELKFGKVYPTVILQWLETEFVSKTIEFDGHTLVTSSRELQLKGKPKTFKRKITKKEREHLLQDIVKVVKEISDDYTLWKSTVDNL